MSLHAEDQRRHVVLLFSQPASISVRCGSRLLICAQPDPSLTVPFSRDDWRHFGIAQLRHFRFALTIPLYRVVAGFVIRCPASLPEMLLSQYGTVALVSGKAASLLQLGPNLGCDDRSI